MGIAALLIPVEGGPSQELDKTLRSWLKPRGRRVEACLLPAGPSSAARELRDWAGAWARDCGGSLSVHEGPVSQWDVLKSSRFALFALPGDILPVPLAEVLARALEGRSEDVLVFNERRLGKSWRLIRRPALERYTLWHVPYIGRALAVRSELLRLYPDDAAAQLRSNDAHLFHLWLSGKSELRWRTLPEILLETVSSEEAPAFRPRTQGWRLAYREAFSALQGSFELLEDAQGQAPYRVEPRRKARAVSVIVPFRDRSEETKRCLDSVLRQRLSAELELILVDNQSEAGHSDAIRGFLRERGASSRTRWLCHDAPFNHSRQCNMGIEAARGEVLLLLNNDAELLDESLISQMAAWALVGDVGTVGCRMTDHAGGLVSAGIRARTDLQARGPVSPVEEDRSPFFAEHVRQTYANTFACAAISKERLDGAGTLNETEFPNGYNDVEYCLRLRRAGYRHMYLGHLRARHVPGGSRGRCDESRQKALLRLRFPKTAEEARLQLECLESGS
ncbi:MAG: glycosyltransferase [Elusimicrobia bacterium]|nr:glycosyltransferase [Elusimicrobiota bacterium]